MINFVKKRIFPFVFGVFFLGCVLLLQMNDLPYFDAILKRIDGFIYDSMTRLNLHKTPQKVRVITIDIDDASIKAEGRWPWPRDAFVTLLTNLKKAGVVVVVFDIVLSEPEINYALGLKNKIKKFASEKNDIKPILFPLLDKLAPLVDNDQAFAHALHNNDVVLGYLFHEDATIKKSKLPTPLLNQTGAPVSPSSLSLHTFQGYNGILDLFSKSAPAGGFVSNIPDIDGVIRHGLMLARFDNKVYASLTLAAIMHYLLSDKISLVTDVVSGKNILYGIKVGGLFIPTNRNGQILVPFWGFPGTIDSYSATDIINNKIPAEALAGSIAIVGSSMLLLSDLHSSPVTQNFPGFEIVANMISGILSQQLPTQHEWNTRQGVAQITCIGMLYAGIFTVLGPTALLLVYVVSLLTWLGLTFWFFSVHGLYIPPTPIIFLLTLQAIFNFTYSFFLERRQKNKLRELFGQYIPASHIEEIIDESQDYSLNGETREMSVFFSDIRSFTSLTEPLDASEVKRLLNAFFTPVTDIIFKHQGTIDKYVGDMVMAFWGAPIPNANHAHQAIAAALEIYQQLPEINKKLETLHLPSLNIGMGISSGLMNVGDMGSNFRRSYTVLGDTVNLASRLQDLTKFYQVNILVSESTRANQDDFLWCPIDRVAVVGRKQSLIIYQPLGYYHAIPQIIKEQLKIYEEALSYYYQKDWLSARQLFETLNKSLPTKYLYTIYLSRIIALQQNPPSDEWDGTFIHSHK